MAKIRKMEELVKLPFRDFAVNLILVTKSLIKGSAQLIGMIQKVRRKITSNGNSKLKMKLPNNPKGMDKKETFSPRKRASMSWVENNPQININLGCSLKEKKVPRKAKL